MLLTLALVTVAQPAQHLPAEPARLRRRLPPLPAVLSLWRLAAVNISSTVSSAMVAAAPHRRRLRVLSVHVGGQRPSAGLSAAPAAAVDVTVEDSAIVRDADRNEEVGLLSTDQMRRFVRDGLVAVQLDDIPASVHQDYYETAMRLDQSNSNTGGNSHEADSPQALGGDLEEGMNTVFRSAKFHGALRCVLGPDFMIGNNWKDNGEIGYSYRMHVSNVGGDQGWHLDGTDHGNTQATVRDIKPRQCMMFYYPGGVNTRDMGPTACVSGSHYYNIDREGKSRSEDDLGSITNVPTPDDFTLRDQWFSGGGPSIRVLGNSQVLEDTRLVVPPGSIVICGHHTYHRATRSVEGCQWRAMFKLNAARVSEPSSAPSWLHDHDTAPHHAFGDHDSMSHHGVWEGVWGWLNGRQDAAAQFQSPHSVESLARTLATSSSEVDCVDAGYSLGLLVHKAASGAESGTALAALEQSFLSARERSRRASMHGLGAAGDAAVPFLLTQLTFEDEAVQETDSTGWGTEDDASGDSEEGVGGSLYAGRRFAQQSRTIGALHALGQCALHPSTAVVEGVIAAIDTAMQLIASSSSSSSAAQEEGEEGGGLLAVHEVGEDGPVFALAGGGFDWAALERRRAVSEASCSLGLIGQRLISMAGAATDQAVRRLYLSC